MRKDTFDLSQADDEPRSPGRRALFQGAALAGGVALIGTLSSQAALAETPAEPIDPALETVPFYGKRQSGITNPIPAAGLVASFNVLATNRNELSQLFQILTERFAFLTQGGPAASADPAFPAPDSGLLGPVVTPNKLTATLAVGASLFDGRFELEPVKPRQLVTMTAFPNDRLDSDWCHGDLLMQFCSDSAEVNLHAMRDIIKNTPSLLMVRWKQDGFLPQSAIRAAGKLTPRNMLGFKDGTANLDATDGGLMDKIVWVQRDGKEPAWAVDGTYQVVRIIRNLVEQWDRTPLADQQSMIGRHKMSGAPLTGTNEHDIPAFASDPKGKTIPLDAHIRLANPRTPETQANLILRRPYNYSRGANKAGQLDMGLLFNCFQADLEAGFITVQKRLNGESLEEYIKPTGGGYYFVLPGVANASQYLGQTMLEAASAA
jgi:deferrochelatase/peroxidase EfeB